LWSVSKTNGAAWDRERDKTKPPKKKRRKRWTLHSKTVKGKTIKEFVGGYVRVPGER